MNKVLMFVVLFTIMWFATEASAKTLRQQYAGSNTHSGIMMQEVAGSMVLGENGLADKKEKDFNNYAVFCPTPSKKKLKYSCRCVKNMKSEWSWECIDDDDWPERKENSVCSKVKDTKNMCYFVKELPSRRSKKDDNEDGCKYCISYYEYCYDDHYSKVLDCSETKLNLWFVWLIIASVVVALVVAGIVVYCCCCRRRKQQQQEQQQQQENQQDNLRDREMSEQQSDSQVPVYFDGKNVYYYHAENNNSNNVDTNNIRSTLPVVSSIHPMSSTVDGSVVNGQPMFSYAYDQANPFQSATLTPSNNTNHEGRVTTTAATSSFDVSKNSTNNGASNNNIDKTTVAHVFRSGNNSESEATHNNPYREATTNAS